MPLNTDLLRDFAQATYEKQEAEKVVKMRKRIIDELDPKIREMFTEEGVPGTQITVEARNVETEFMQLLRDFYNEAIKAQSEDQFEETVADFAEGASNEGLLVPSTPEYTKTLSVGSRIWAKPVPTGVDENGDPKVTEADYERACRALEARGFAEYVQERFNIISFSSAVKEDVENGEIPTGTEFFGGAVEIAEKFQIQARASRKKNK